MALTEAEQLARLWGAPRRPPAPAHGGCRVVAGVGVVFDAPPDDATMARLAREDANRAREEAASAAALALRPARCRWDRSVCGNAAVVSVAGVFLCAFHAKAIRRG